MASYDTSLGTSADLDITFPEGSALDNSKDYKLLLCANIGYYSDLNSVQDIISLCNGEMEKDVLSILMRVSGVESGKTPEDEQGDDRNRMAMDKLPMGASVVKKGK
ncbi:MAG: hypothetical protein LUG51_10740 [Tannerellaceae bacterium]|nr:hypothetical protein [Tannerellaceae bacterium]